jgi:phosphoribosyl 1,2-cyclic phosphodiesterase
MFSIRFWGVRGSFPSPGPNTAIYGGNTSCLEIRADERLIIIDFGSGARPLGDWLMKNDLKKYGKIKADIFLTHTHWDHLLGFPMFDPIYMPGTELSIKGPVSLENNSLKSIIETQFSYEYWPVSAGELSANIEYNEIKEGEFDLGGGLTVNAKFLNHPIFCLGYRFNYKNKSIATVYDHEPYRNVFPSDPACEDYDEKTAKEGELAAADENEKIKQFIKGADIVIHDAHFTKEEYPEHIGWGHCTHEYSVQSTKDIDIKKLVLFHHEPSRTDSQLEQIEKSYANNKAPEVIVAKEGLILEA